MSARSIVGVVALVVVALAAGWWGRAWIGPSRDAAPAMGAATDSGPCPGGAAPLYWKAPMDPTYVRDAPGKSPMGMDLVPECPSAGAGAPGDAVVIDPETLQNSGVRTARVQRRDLVRSVRAASRVAYDERRVAHVHTKIQGWVEALFIDFVGQAVERGEPLLEIYSPELVATQEELLLAARYRDATDASPFEDVRGSGESLFEATKRRLMLWDVAERDIERLVETGEVKRTLTLYAPASGVVTRLGVRSGMEVGPNMNLYTIADLSRVWVLASVYEYELPWLAVGQTATFEPGHRPDQSREARVTYIAPFLDPVTRTAEVRLELDNEDGMLKPEMFGDTVIAGEPRPGALAVPSEAVIHSGTRTLVLIALGDGRFEPREIQAGLDGGDGWLEVREGLEEGEEVVVSGQFMIESESNLQEAVHKLRGAAASAGMGPIRNRAEGMDHTGHEANAGEAPAASAMSEHAHSNRDEE